MRGPRSALDIDDLVPEYLRCAHPENLTTLRALSSRSGHDMLLKPSTSKGGHGFDPDRPAMHASLILNGSAVRMRGSIGVVKMTQIGPTLASILGVGLSSSAVPPLNLGSEIQHERRGLSATCLLFAPPAGRRSKHNAVALNRRSLRTSPVRVY